MKPPTQSLIPILAVVCLLAVASTAGANPRRGVPPARYYYYPPTYVPPRPPFPPTTYYYPPVVPAYPMYRYSYGVYSGYTYPPVYTPYGIPSRPNYNSGFYFWYRYR